jgi:predicted membrane metal-binding protein
MSMHFHWFALTLLALCLRYFFFLVSDLSSDLHQSCLDYVQDSEHKLIYQALACGQRLYNYQHVHALKQMGIIHVFVVSGMHLSFLSKLIHHLFPHQFSKWLQVVVLTSLVLCCQLQTPALRAWLGVLLSSSNSRLSLGLSSPTRLFYTVILCLIIDPQAYHSISLPLSWTACLGLQLSKKTWTQSFYCYWILLPIMISFAPLSPWTILVNTLLTPLIGWLLFPLSLLTVLIPALGLITHWLWSLLIQTTLTLAPYLEIGASTYHLDDRLLYWLYPLLLNLYFMGRTHLVSAPPP